MFERNSSVINQNIDDKTVVLHECKRHTDRHLATYQVLLVLSCPWRVGGGYPGRAPPCCCTPPPSWPGWGEGCPRWVPPTILTWPGGVPQAGTPLLGYPLSWPGEIPQAGAPLLGYPPSWPGWGRGCPGWMPPFLGYLPVLTWPGGGGVPGGRPPG